MATNLDPQQLAQILGLRDKLKSVDNGASRYWYDPTYTDQGGGSLDNWQILLNRGMDYAQGGGGENSYNSAKDTYTIQRPRLEAEEGNLGDQWDQNGNYLGTYSTEQNGWKDMMQVMALMAGGYYGGNALANAYGAPAATSAAGGGMANGAFLGEGVASGVPAWDAAAINSALASGELGTAAGYMGQTMNGGTALETAGKVLTGNGGAAAGGGGSGALGSVGSALGSLGANGSAVGGLLGAAAGALDSGDKTQSTNRDPWAPAQDFLKQQINQGQALSNKYQNQPFSPAQQAAYGNVGGLLDAINANAGGLVGNANASGQNQFDRSNPNKKLTGSSFNMSGFAPGLLGFLGSK